MDSLTLHPFARPATGLVLAPGSKSITNRALLLAALADGVSRVEEALESEDTVFFAECLRRLGVAVTHDPQRRSFEVVGRREGPPPQADVDLWVGNAGTAARFLLPFAAMGRGKVRFDGVPAMRRRPMGDLLEVLAGQGVDVKFEGEPGFFPVRVEGDGLKGGRLSLSATKSSQQVSALIMAAPLASEATVIELLGDIVSEPYIALTLAMMRQWGAKAEQASAREIRIDPNHRYEARDYLVEPDASSASYFFAAAAATGGRVGVKNLSRRSLQGDVAFVDVLEQMGCQVFESDTALYVQGPKSLRGVSVDMNAISDTAPTLAAIASNAIGPVTIRNVEHMRWKETDRVEAIANEIRRCGGHVETFKDGLTVFPARLRSAAVETYEDHRIAMSMAIAGIANEGVRILDPGCVGKTFRPFFEVLADLRRQSEVLGPTA